MHPRGRQRPQFTQPLTSLEICAGAGGQAVGLHNAGFDHLALVEWDQHAVRTLRANVHDWPGWDKSRIDALEPMDVREFLGSKVHTSLDLEKGDLDLLAGGVPCPPFSLAGKRLGKDDERDLFPDALRIVRALRPKAVMIENVRGILEPPEVFIDYRRDILNELDELDYVIPEISESWPAEKQDREMRQVWRRMDANRFGVPQLRPRAILVAIRKDVLASSGVDFLWPLQLEGKRATVVDELAASMEARCRKFWNKNKDGERARPGEPSGKHVYQEWLRKATDAVEAGKGIAPTLVGGSRKHGGADLGPTRAKRAWEALGVNAMGLANDPSECDPERDLFREAGPMLTVEQAAVIQGFPEVWKFPGKKTAKYRQVGNAFPPPVAEAVGRAIAAVLRPEQRDELLHGYEMDDGGSEFAAPRLEQMSFSLSEVS
ncbi:DNA cytosine methyltransferase [Streptomyces sp. LBUM 1478]|uniref:DNA cytosine methyltransferase n=1 Tax=Streptomyces TaxID=1883 RepID=UPI000765ED32|nr:MULTISPECIES: DNA (cytosine-5-)-methyltransferase [Streptomyces]MBP5863469.1 DNA cytosine methyltransferase [Streptomyces sp. LBUM 1484]MBP5906150.1 DNA cytosine methyltransferase [Streptomyces sp. LBUM 1478]MBP5931270.1 DNA cytosine methyltransferase [Streptomyces sp. LBUM 1479]MBP5899779.1 DNA cytosine methyltransferase [Streptomyces sp. LBUM 1488]MDW8473276.1 DNA (cytosine-5-)-methyltransferase [Streptomyces scabiei]